MHRNPAPVLLLVLLLLLRTTPAAAQEHVHDSPPPGGISWSAGGQAIGLLTHAAPALRGESFTEGYLTQPNLMAHAGFWGGRASLTGTLNLEGLTLRRGELNAGIWGEGYIDRRHPHTYLHELMATVRLPGTSAGDDAISLSFGKGFVPFGTDDPMMRPMVKYPANHHLAQILERLVLVAAVRRGPVLLEAGLFNGDEPAGPGDFATVARFGDSWSTRATVLPLRGVELSGSYAFVASPEFPAGSGLDHRKASAALRYERSDDRGGRRYALLEWARTDEYIETERTFTFRSVLAEGALRRSGTEVALRYERTVRPEEERTGDPFRSPRPHADVHILGATRWDILTIGVSRELAPHRDFRLRPFAEASYAAATETLGSLLFDPAEFYGSDRIWSFSAGVRVEAGAIHPRMGRYGAALPHPVSHDAHAER